MKKILVTRAAAQAAEFGAALERHGFEPVFQPVIRIVPAGDWSAADAALRSIRSYDALIFTSPNAVRFFIERMARAGLTCDDLPAGFGLGKKTKATMAECGVKTAPTADALDANMLAGEICAFLSRAGFDGVNGMRFLFPCGDRARPELPAALREHGASVESVVVYKNELPAGTGVRGTAALLAANAIACVTFFSPSAVKNFLALFPDFKTKNGNVALAAIGNTTADALRAHGLPVALVASKPEAEQFAGELAERFLNHAG